MSESEKIEEYLEGLKRLSEIESGKAFEHIFEALKYFNTKIDGKYIVKVSETNCVNVVVAVEEYLKTGKVSTALYSKAQDIYELEKIFNSPFLSYKIPSLQKVMKEGERGIIYGDRGAFRIGHVFNIIKKDGKILFLDGQSGANANLRDGFISFKYLKTN